MGSFEATRVFQFMMLDSLMITYTKVEEDPQRLTYEIEMIFRVMYASEIEDIEFATN